MKAYEILKNYLTEINDLQYLINIVNWESKISGSSTSRDYLIDVITRLEEKKFKLTTSEEYENILINLLNCDNFNKLSIEEKNAINNLYTKYNNFKKIPADFYKEYVKVIQVSNKIWEEAKKNNNYDLFKPHLKKVIDVTKQYYRYIDSEKNLYDVMLNEYEYNMTSDIIDNLFEELKNYLIPLIKEVKTKNKDYNINYTNEELIKAAEYLLEYIGFDMNKGVLGIYPHGFTEKLNSHDVRIAFDKTNNPISFVGTITHEGGHGIFEQNPKEELAIFNNTGIDNLYALHESQSRFFENILARNKNFWIPIYDDVKKLLKLDIELDEFVKLLNNVCPGTIRVNADELTYALHIIIRYEIERDLFNDKITIEELPNIWNDKMQKYLGILPKNDSEGLMQDVHWSEGLFGYFPSYLLGNIYDGIFINTIEEKIGSIDNLLKEGKIKEITNYLIENIYQYGGSFNSIDIFKRISKEEISAKPIIKYYEKKYRQKNSNK